VHALWQRWRSGGDAEARAALLERHLPYAQVIAATAYRQRGHDAVEFDDYVQFARVGLLAASRGHQPRGLSSGGQPLGHSSQVLRGGSQQELVTRSA